jgi:hypothetical protein
MMLPIRYRDFYDIPRAFVIEHPGETLFFDCSFDERGRGRWGTARSAWR